MAATLSRTTRSSEARAGLPRLDDVTYMSYHVSVYPEGLEIERLRYLILAAQREGNRSLAAGLAGLGLTPAQAEVLRMLSEHGPLSLTGLGQLLVCESGTNPSRLVARLVDAGLVARSAHADDARQIVLSLTAEGTARAADSLIVEERFMSGCVPPSAAPRPRTSPPHSSRWSAAPPPATRSPDATPPPPERHQP